MSILDIYLLPEVEFTELFSYPFVHNNVYDYAKHNECERSAKHCVIIYSSTISREYTD